MKTNVSFWSILDSFIISRKVFFFLISLFFALLLCMICGEFVNIDSVVLLLFSVSLILCYCKDGLFFIKHAYTILLSLMLVTGVFVCDNFSVTLYEIGRESSYVNAFSFLVVSKILFFSAVFVCYSKWRKKIAMAEEQERNRNLFGKKIASFAVWVFIFLEMYSCYILLQIGSNSMLGVSRSAYTQEFLPDFIRSIRGYIAPMLAILIVSNGKFKNIQCGLFLLFSLFICFWTGEKFGIYFSLFNIILMASRLDWQKIQLKKNRLFYRVVIVFFFLMTIVYVQYYLLLDYSFDKFFNYLFDRLAQQGQVWWSIFDIQKYSYPNINEFSDELLACLGFLDVKTYPYLGQWKMMNVAAFESPIIQYRISIELPLTSTTEASIFYYFGYIGVILFSPVLGVLYAYVYAKLELALRCGRVFSAFIYTKLFVFTMYLIGSSDIQSIFGWKGLLYILMVSLIEYFHLDNIRIGFLQKRFNV